jgi:hypothetical protein
MSLVCYFRLCQQNAVKVVQINVQKNDEEKKETKETPNQRILFKLENVVEVDDVGRL